MIHIPFSFTTKRCGYFLTFTNIMSAAVEHAVACAPVTQRARVRSPVGTNFLGEVFSGSFLTCKTNVRKLHKGPRISFGRHNDPFTFILLDWIGSWMMLIVFHVRVESEKAPALSWSFIRGGPPYPCVVKKVCMWSKVNSLSRQVVAL